MSATVMEKEAKAPLAPRGTPLPARHARALAAGVVAVGVLAAYHLAMVFLAISPPNILKDHAMRQVNWWIYPWFEQGWKMFAPEPVATNRAFEVRVRDGASTSRWHNLTAADDAHIRGNPVTSRQHSNVLRRTWDGLQGLDLKKGPRNEAEAIRFAYARNVVAQRMQDLGYRDFGKLQIRVRQQKVPPHNAMNKTQPWQTTQLPWWGVPQK